ncbi:MAG: MFS transporter [Bryobacteraceae bacterium]
MRSRVPLRWVAMAVFVLSSSLNYMDRLLLAAAAPLLKHDFQLTNRDYGLILSAVSIAYAISAPLMGLFLDRVGLNLGVSLAVGFWSIAGAATGLVRNFGQLVGSRVTLSAWQAAGIPSTGKASALYLESKELALGAGLNQLGLSIGGIAAPLVMGLLAPRYGWRSAFFVCGTAGFVWIPAWLWMARRTPRQLVSANARQFAVGDLLRDQRFWGLMAATVFAMTIYTLWSNWTTLYFVESRGMTQGEANRRFAWIPPLFATLGGLGGGALAYRWIRRGVDVLRARLRVCLLSALFILLTAGVPLMPSPGWAAAAISVSYFWSACLSANLYVMPIDLFGPGRAAFGVAALTFSYGLMQAFASPAIGGLVDRFGFASVCGGVAMLPLVAVAILRFAVVPARA